MKKILRCLLLLAASVPAFGQGLGAESLEAKEGDAPAASRVFAMRADAARLLASGANNERAWGAYMAGRHGLGGQAPALVEILKDPALGYGHEENLVRQAALDALIRLGAKVPADVLRALPQDFSDEVVILLAFNPPENGAALLEMFAERGGDGGADPHWLAIGNLLTEAKTGGFAAALLRELKIEATLQILSREGDGGIGFGGGGGSGCCGTYSPTRGFPPVSYYTLTSAADRGATVFAPGKRPVYYARSTHPGGVEVSYSSPAERDLVRVEYLAALLNTYKDDLGVDARPSAEIVCTDARQCRRELIRLRHQIEESYARLVARLAENGHLAGAGDAPASPDLTFTLYDLRSRKTFPLPPELKGVKIVVEVMSAGEEDSAGGEEP